MKGSNHSRENYAHKGDNIKRDGKYTEYENVD
jgi:hypothetical protein